MQNEGAAGTPTEIMLSKEKTVPCLSLKKSMALFVGPVRRGKMFEISGFKALRLFAGSFCFRRRAGVYFRELDAAWKC
jgi:hypothetical protein